MYMLTLDAINFGSGWFPTLRKRPGCSGYYTVAWALADRFRAEGPWTADELGSLGAAEVATVLGQEPEHELMALYARALNDLGGFLGDRAALDVVAAAGGSAERLAEQLAAGMPFFDDRGFYKRAQIVPSDLTLAGVAEFEDLDRLTIFADNLVPHVLRMDGVLRLRRRARGPHRRRRADRAGHRGTRDPGVRGARLRGDRRGHGRPAAGPGHLAVEPRAGAALQGGAAAPHPHGLLLRDPRGELSFPPEAPLWHGSGARLTGRREPPLRYVSLLSAAKPRTHARA